MDRFKKAAWEIREKIAGAVPKTFWLDTIAQALRAERERTIEECAKVPDKLLDQYKNDPTPWPKDVVEEKIRTAALCGKAIRALRQLAGGKE